MQAYIHPNDAIIEDFIDRLDIRNLSLLDSVQAVFRWFDENVSYSRLNAPYFPLQRSDIDVLNMKCGTCGDYSNLLASVYIKLGYQVKYAYLKRDCYGNPQDHICIAVFDDNKWKLIDATEPYRKFHGFCVLHKEFDLLSPTEFRDKMKDEETHWIAVARAWGNENYAGLLYAPWIHESIVFETEDVLESVFYMLSVENPSQYQVYTNYLVYSKDAAFSPMMCRIEGENEFFRFSINPATHIWDENQWGPEYLKKDIPPIYRTSRFIIFSKNISENRNSIERTAKHILLPSSCGT